VTFPLPIRENRVDPVGNIPTPHRGINETVNKQWRVDKTGPLKDPGDPSFWANYLGGCTSGRT